MIDDGSYLFSSFLTIKHNSIKYIQYAVKRYYLHNESGYGIYVHNKNVVLGHDI